MGKAFDKGGSAQPPALVVAPALFYPGACRQICAHAAEEMAEDSLTVVDVEHAVLTGSLARIQKEDPRKQVRDRGNGHGWCDLGGSRGALFQ